MHPPHWVLASVCGGAFLLFATAAAAAPQTYTIVIDKMKFLRMPDQLHRGDTIIWANKDFLRHSATATNQGFDVDLPPGATRKMVLTKVGTFPFVCRYHPGMRGTLVIK